MFSSMLFHASYSFIYVTLCPATLMLFALRRASCPSNPMSPAKTTDFYATLASGVFMTLAGVFGLVAESVGSSDSRWWFSASAAMQALGILIAQLAVIQLLTPDYLFGLLSIAVPPNGVPSWRIYALIFAPIIASVTSLIYVFIASQTPSLPSSIPTFISICLPLPLLLSLARIVNSARVEAQSEPPATTAYTRRSSKCTELGLTSSDDTSPLPITLRFPRIWEFTFGLQCVAAMASAFEIVEGAIGGSVPALKLLTAVGNVIWGGGIMTIHFVIIHEPTYRSPMDPALLANAPCDLERVAEQLSEDFMTLRDPFASPTQVGFPLPPSPSAPRRKPKRRASEPLQLTRFGSFAGLQAEANEKQAGPETNRETRFLEALVRHALFSTGRAESDSMHVVSHVDDQPTGLAKPHERPNSPGDACLSGTSTPTIRQKRSKELGATKEPVPPILGPVRVQVLPWHPFRPVTPPRPTRAASRMSQSQLAFTSPPSSFPLSSPSSAESGYSVPVIWSSAPSAYTAPPSPSSSDSSSSFVSPPPTPTPGPSRSKSGHKVRLLVPARPAPVLDPAPIRRRGSGSA